MAIALPACAHARRAIYVWMVPASDMKAMRPATRAEVRPIHWQTWSVNARFLIFLKVQCAGVADRALPSCRLRSRKCLPGDGIPLDIIDAVLRFSLGASTIGSAGTWLEPNAGKANRFV